MHTFDGLMVSYAQRGEDVILRRAFRGRTTGFYIDVGANHPLHDSVTKYFSELGWRGINVEPVPALHRALCDDRPRDINIQAAVTSKSGDTDFVEPENDHLRATSSSHIVDYLRNSGRKLKSYRVRTLTLARMCEQYVPPNTEIDFLKVDVEGAEEEVLRSGDFKRFRPKVLVLEAYTAERHVDFPFVRDLGYVEKLFDGLNRYYVRNEDEKTLGPPIHEFSAACTYDDYILFRHAHELAAARRVLGDQPNGEWPRFIDLGKEWDAMGPVIQELARRLANLKDANPAVKSALKRLLRHAA